MGHILRRNSVLEHFIGGKVKWMRGPKRKNKQLLGDKFERGSTRSHVVQNSLGTGCGFVVMQTRQRTYSKEKIMPNFVI